MGVWIETRIKIKAELKLAVTPFVGVWIETLQHTKHNRCSKSHPSWVCGLKQEFYWFSYETMRVTPFVGVWIETYCCNHHP